MTTYNNSTNFNINNLLRAYGESVHGQLDDGFDGYLLTFMFGQIPGSDQARMLEMKKQLTQFYGRLAKASVPKPKRRKWVPFLPKAILVPDKPVPKHTKIGLKDVTVNNGLHWHGIFLTHPLAPKLREPLDQHILKNLRKYRVGNLREIGVAPITDQPAYVTEYGMKALKRGFSEDDVVIFPRTLGELPCNEPVRAVGDRPNYDFQRSS